MDNILTLNFPFSNRKILARNWKILTGTFWTLSFFSIVFLLIYYVFQVNAEISETYLIKKYEKGIEKILNENKALEMNFAQINSLDKITELVKKLNYEKPNKISYIKVLNNQVVKK